MYLLCEVGSIHPILKWENWGSEVLHHLLKDMQLVDGRAGDLNPVTGMI